MKYYESDTQCITDQLESSITRIKTIDIFKNLQVLHDLNSFDVNKAGILISYGGLSFERSSQGLAQARKEKWNLLLLMPIGDGTTREKNFHLHAFRDLVMAVIENSSFSIGDQRLQFEVFRELSLERFDELELLENFLYYNLAVSCDYEWKVEEELLDLVKIGQVTMGENNA